MNESISLLDRLALSLDAPIKVTGSEPGYHCLEFGPKREAQNMLNSWWGVTTADELEEMLAWLLSEGHRVVFDQEYNRMHFMTHSERQDYVESFRKTDSDQFVRASTVNKYLFNMGASTVLAFDIARYKLLLGAGVSMGWISEENFWQRIRPLASQIVDKRLFNSATDYLLSYYVGRTYGMKHREGSIKESLREMNKLLTDPESPFFRDYGWQIIREGGSHAG